MGGTVTQFSIEPPDSGTTKFEVEPPSGSDQPAQTPGFFKRIFAGEALTPDPNSGFLEHAGSALLGTVPAVYHAFADEPTEEEKARYAPGEKAAGEAPGTQTSGLKRVGLGIRRLTVDPITEAHLEDYTSGKISPRAALSVAPAALGTGVGSFVGAELAGRALGKVKVPATPGELRESITKGLPDKAQRLGRKVFGVESDLKREANKGIKEATKAEETHAEATQTAAERQALAKKLDETSMKAGEHIENVEKGVAKEADAKFKAVREKLGITEKDPGPEIPPEHLVAMVRDIELHTLQNIPENIKEFRAIYGHGEEAPEGLREAYKKANRGEEPLGGLPFTWDKLQSLKSRIDARLRNARRMNGDLKRGLRQLRDGVVEQMGTIAEPGGASDLWKDAKAFYRQFKEDFHEPTGPSGSGSPVARALDAVDPKNIRQPFASTQSTLGNRGVEILRKYPQHGGNEAAATVEEMMGHHENLRKMGADKAIKPAKIPVVDAEQSAREALMRRSARIGDLNARDMGVIASGGIGGLVGGVIRGNLFESALGAATGVGLYETGKFAISRALSDPRVVEWLVRTPPEEIAVINKMKGADKIKLVNTLTDAAIKNKVTPSPAVKALIGPANVARIMAAGAGVSNVHNRKDALELMGR